MARVRTEGGLVATCACLDLGGTAPLAPWAELVGTLAEAVEAPPAGAGWPQVLGALAPGIESSFGTVAGPPLRGAPDLERIRLFEAVVSLIGWASRATGAARRRRRPRRRRLEPRPPGPRVSAVGRPARPGPPHPGAPTLAGRPWMPSSSRCVVEACCAGLRSGAAQQPRTCRPSVNGSAPCRRPSCCCAVEAAEGNPLLVIEWARALSRGEQEVPASLLAVCSVGCSTTSTTTPCRWPGSPPSPAGRSPVKRRNTPSGST